MVRDAAFTVRIESEMKAKLEEIARGERRTLSQLVEFVLAQYLESRQRRSKPKPPSK